MKIASYDIRALRGCIEHGWMYKISERMGFHQNALGFRLSGKIHWKLEEINQICRVIIELGAEKYGDKWELVGADEFLSFKDVEMREIELPPPKMYAKSK